MIPGLLYALALCVVLLIMLRVFKGLWGLWLFSFKLTIAFYAFGLFKLTIAFGMTYETHWIVDKWMVVGLRQVVRYGLR